MRQKTLQRPHEQYQAIAVRTGQSSTAWQKIRTRTFVPSWQMRQHEEMEATIELPTHGLTWYLKADEQQHGVRNSEDDAYLDTQGGELLSSSVQMR